MDEKSEQLYSPKQVATELNITPDVLRKWADEFNIQTVKSDGGHRRYTKENIELLMKIREKLQDQLWSWKQVRQWLNNGEEEPVFATAEESSKMNNKLDTILERLETQEMFNKALVQKLEQMEQRNQKLEQYIEKQLPNRLEIEQRDKQLLEGLNKSLDHQREQVAAALEEKKEKAGLFSFLSFFKRS